MDDLTHATAAVPARRRVLRAGLLTALIPLVLSGLVMLTPFEGLVLIAACVPLGLALGLLVGPRTGPALRLFALAVALGVIVFFGRRSVVPAGSERPLILGLAAVVLVAASVLGFRSIKDPARSAQRKG